MLNDKIVESLSAHFGSSFRIQKATPLGGGSINEAAKLESNLGDFFIKWNNAKAFPKMFELEARSLNEIAATQCIRIPKVILTEEIGNISFLLLEYIEPGQAKSDFWESFANSLAQLHQNSQKHFGLSYGNYIGSLRQSNSQHDKWTTFFVHERLMPHVKLAEAKGYMDLKLLKSFELLYTKLGDYFPEEPPSLLHGDLWSGNFMVDNRGDACIYDPALYYGHRMVDIAMTKMFGGFPQEFYHYYHECFPMNENWQKQIAICNLYPNLVHLNLFGIGYMSEIKYLIAKNI